MPDPISPAISWLQRLPKIELHLHLEGAIPLEVLWTLVQKYGGNAEVLSMECLQSKFQYRDFPQFIETWVWKNQFLRQYEDFTYIAEAVARDLWQQNIFYVEAFFSPRDLYRYGLRTQGITEAIRKGLDCVEGVKVALVADLVRNYGPEQRERTLAEVAEVKSQGVIRIGICGSEQAYPPEPYQPVFDQARKLGFHTTAHAGEAAKASSIWGAVKSLHVERIGHGTRAAEDPALVDTLAEQQHAIALCPLSNLRTGVVADLKSLAMRRFFDKGMLITINTDDPKMFKNSLVEEYDMLMKVHRFSRSEIKILILNAVQASWMAASQKRTLINTFQMMPAWQEV